MKIRRINRPCPYDLECFLSSDPYLGPVSLGSLLLTVFTIFVPAPELPFDFVLPPFPAYNVIQKTIFYSRINLAFAQRELKQDHKATRYDSILHWLQTEKNGLFNLTYFTNNIDVDVIACCVKCR